MTKKILVATREKGKLDELLSILGDLDFKIVTLEDIAFPKIEPREKNNSFTENAIIKAKFYGKKSGLLTIADDSGLIVDALPNKLGVRSKRYKKGTDIDRYNKLLKDLENVPREKRSARFISAVAIYDPQTNEINTMKGICEGEISFKPKGSHGFGYDPVFVVAELNKHFAELSMEEKNKISHRAKALIKIKPFLKHYEK